MFYLKSQSVNRLNQVFAKFISAQTSTRSIDLNPMNPVKVIEVEELINQQSFFNSMKFQLRQDIDDHHKVIQSYIKQYSLITEIDKANEVECLQICDMLYDSRIKLTFSLVNRQLLSPEYISSQTRSAFIISHNFLDTFDLKNLVV